MRTNPPIDFASVDPQARYRELNKKYFGSRLPDHLPITFKPLKGRSGECRTRVIAVPPFTIADVKSRARFQPVGSNMARIMVTGIVMSSLMRYDEGDFDGVLLHEMCHVSTALMGWIFEDHGSNFLEEARRVGAAAGLKVPLTHDTKGAEVSKAKRTGVALFERGPDQVYYLFDPRGLEAFTQKVRSDSVMFDRARVMVVTSGVWARSTVKKKPEKYGARYWKLSADVARDIAGAEVVAEFDGRKVSAELIAAERAERGVRASANPRRKSDLLAKVLELRAEIARRAQAVYDAWDQDADGVDEEFGGGGICDAVSDEIASVLSEADIDTVAGGQDGDDHAYVLAIDDSSAYSVDIPPGVYERGGGYSWQKIPGVTIAEDDVAVDEVCHSDVADRVGENPGPAATSHYRQKTGRTHCTYAKVHDAVRWRLREVGAEPRWLADFVAHHCPQADREHAESERQHCHVGHLPGKVCYASAADDLPLAHQLGLVLHEFGHLCLQGKDMRRPWKWNEQDASDAGGNLVGLQVPFRGRLTLEWARPPRWLLDELGVRE